MTNYTSTYSSDDNNQSNSHSNLNNYNQNVGNISGSANNSIIDEIENKYKQIEEADSHYPVYVA